MNEIYNVFSTLNDMCSLLILEEMFVEKRTHNLATQNQAFTNAAFTNKLTGLKICPRDRGRRATEYIGCVP